MVVVKNKNVSSCARRFPGPFIDSFWSFISLDHADATTLELQEVNGQTELTRIDFAYPFYQYTSHQI